MMFSDSLKDAILQSVVEGAFSEATVEIAEIEEYIETIELALRANNKLDSKKHLSNYRDNIPFPIPQNWYGIKLKDIALRDITYGIVKLGTTDASGVKVLRCSDVKEGYIDQSNIRTVKKSLSDQYKRTILNGGEIVVNVRGTLGGFSIVPKELSGYNIAREVAMIDLVDGFNKEYVLLCLMSPYFWKFQNMNLRGIAYKGLNINLLNEFIVPIPPIRIQNEIVNKYRVVSQKLKEYKTYESKLLALKKQFPSDMRDSILQAAMQGELTERSDKDSSADAVIQVMSEYHKKAVKPVAFDDDAYSFPESWSCVKLIDATVFYTGNSISENIKATRYTGLKDGYDYIGTKDVEFNHTITYDNGVKIPFDEPGFRYAEKDASLLCIEGGSAGKKIAITDRRVCFGNKLCAFHPIGIDKFFLYYYLQSPVFLHYFRDNISGLIGGVSMSKIKQLSIPIPPIEEQQRIVARLNELLPLCDGLTE